MAKVMKKTIKTKEFFVMDKSGQKSLEKNVCEWVKKNNLDNPCDFVWVSVVLIYEVDEEKTSSK